METTNQVEAGKHYWIMLNQYHEWQAGYVFQDHDRNLWLQLMGVEKPLEVIKLTQLIAVEINPPERITKPIPTMTITKGITEPGEYKVTVVRGER